MPAKSVMSAVGAVCAVADVWAGIVSRSALEAAEDVTVAVIVSVKDVGVRIITCSGICVLFVAGLLEARRPAVVVVGEKTVPGMEDVLVVGMFVRAPPVVLFLEPLGLSLLPEGILTSVVSPVVVVSLVVSPVVVVSPMGLKPVTKFLSASKFLSTNGYRFSIASWNEEREQKRKNVLLSSQSQSRERRGSGIV